MENSPELAGQRGWKSMRRRPTRNMRSNPAAAGPPVPPHLRRCMALRRRTLRGLLPLALPAYAALAAERWQILPPTPTAIPGEHSGNADVNGIRLFYTDLGQGAPVLVLHGGLANSDYLGNQVRALAAHCRVIAVDSRGHGRSTRDDRPFGYDLMADDVVALLDMLAIRNA